MSNELAGLKMVVEITAEVAMWKQKAHDMGKERDYLRTLLEKRLEDVAGDKREPQR